MIENPSLDKSVVKEELAVLKSLYGDFPLEHVVLDVGPEFFEQGRRPISRGRRAEVLLVVVGPEGNVLVHTKAFYPAGTFRLLTGGVRVGEPVEEALTRELFEETGTSAQQHCLIGVLEYDVRCQGNSFPFASYAYRVDIATTRIQPGDEEEQISEFRWIDFSELPAIRNRLSRVPPEWKDWARFRALGHDFVLRHYRRCWSGE